VQIPHRTRFLESKNDHAQIDAERFNCKIRVVYTFRATSGAVERFLEVMMAAQALPHTDMERYPTVKKRFEFLE
jgi:hypothetical protein